MQFSSDEIQKHRVELKNEIKNLEREIKENPLNYSEGLQINNLRFILSELEHK